MDVETSDQLRALTLRLARLEDAVLHLASSRPVLNKEPVEAATAATSLPQVEPVAPVPPVEKVGLNPPSRTARRPIKPAAEISQVSADSELNITQIMGWTGITLLVLAAAYLIRLVYDSGWLTPNRQLFIAVMSGLAMIGAGLKIRRKDNDYASLLPAGGLVVLFLAIYGAHLYYHIISLNLATAAVVCTCLLSIWLGSVFASEIFGLFAVVGSYSAPLLMPALSGSVLDLAIYFTAWSVLFSGYAVAISNRRPYLLAGYFALIAFQITWSNLPGADWHAALWFQSIQFAIFLVATVVFSVRTRQPLVASEAFAHMPLLLIFYALQYSVLHANAPAIAPWVAIGSAIVLLTAYLIAEHVLHVPLSASGYIVGTYCAIVIFHAGFIELMPDAIGVWIVLLVAPLSFLFSPKGSDNAPLMAPIRFLFIGLFVVNFLRTLLMPHEVASDHPTFVALLYTAELYAAYFLGRSKFSQHNWIETALYAAHIGLMRIVLEDLESPLSVSLAWGVLALGTLMLAYGMRDKILGRSSLAIFFASILKVMLFDLSGVTPLARIGSLVVAGISIFIGGLLYKSVMALENDRDSN